jgi:hypothetical protein
MDGVDLYRELAFQALLIADWKQTRQIARAPDRYFERNPILGNHPSVGRVDTYLFAAASYTGLLQQTFRRSGASNFNSSRIAIQANVVKQNYEIGLNVRF